MKLIVDEMLGKLAKWLRILGYDTVYVKPLKDISLVNQAFKEQRILLTRDTALVERKYIPKFILIKNDNYVEQLKQVINELDLKPDVDLLFSRCLLCNTTIKFIQKEDIKDKVPEYVYKNQNSFLDCPKCNKIYWPGTHVEKVKEKLKKILKK